MKEYQKIKWIYQFDEKTHKPIPQIVDYFTPMKDWKREFTEKIDWTNIRVFRDWHKVSFLWRTDNAQIPLRLLNRLQELFMEELFEQKFWEQTVTLYWEWYGWKIQHWIRDYKEQEDFVLFDVEIGWVFLERENIEDVAKSLWLEVVPVRCYGNLELWIQRVKENCLWQDKNNKQIEWLVGRPIWWYLDRLWNRIIVKIKQEHLKQ